LLGIYNPHVSPGQTHKTIEWSVDRIRYWLQVGAAPSKSVVKLLELGNILKPGSVYHPRRTQPPPPPESNPKLKLAKIRERMAGDEH